MTQCIHNEGKTDGRFFVIEGIDGVGKTTISKRVVEELSKNNLTIAAQDPSPNLPISSKLRYWTKNIPLNPLHQAMLFIAARTELLIELVCPAIFDGADVVCDRFYPSTIAYQGSRLSPKEMFVVLDAIDTEPDHIFILTDTWETIKSRVGEGRDLLEKNDILKGAYDAYSIMGTSECRFTREKTNITHINASCIETAVTEIVGIINGIKNRS